MSVKDVFLDLVSYPTASDETTGTTPSTPGQKVLGAHIVEHMKSIGIADARMDEMGYVYGTIPATAERGTTVGFIAHMDTYGGVSGENIHPQVIENYDGGAIALGGSGLSLSPAAEPALLGHVGKTLITTDGTTLLGGDDKAGVAEILVAAEEILRENKPHGTVKIGFTPDEEIGEGASLFDVAGFGCNFAYTVDGEELGELGYETFNAAEAVVDFKGKNIHPGSAKGKMINCAVMAGEFLASLPADETPATTEGREGFYHVESVRAEVETGQIKLIVRDHDMEKFEARKKFVCDVCERLNEKYGRGAAEAKLRDQYFNCIEKIRPHFHLIENARKAFAKEGVTPIEAPVRGGTDGCTLSFMGLPCPNLSTGGLNAHSVLEFIPTDALETMVRVLLRLVEEYGQND